MYKINTLLNTHYPEEMVDKIKSHLLVLTNEAHFYHGIKKYFGGGLSGRFITADQAVYGDAPICYSYPGIVGLGATQIGKKYGYTTWTAIDLLRYLLYCHYYEEFLAYKQPTNYAPPSPKNIKILAEVQPTNEPKEETLMNTNNVIAKYQDKAFSTVDLIHGKPVEDYSEQELIMLIRNARAEQQSISDLITDSKRMATRNEEISKNIKVYLKALDSLK